MKINPFKKKSRREPKKRSKKARGTQQNNHELKTRYRRTKKGNKTRRKQEPKEKDRNTVEKKNKINEIN